VLRVEDGDDDLRSAAPVTRDVTGEGVHVGDDLGGAGAGGRSADPLGEGDVEAAQRALVRADAEEPVGLDDPVETRPQVAEGVVHQAGDGGHRGDVVALEAGEHAADVIGELGVGRRLREGTEIERGLGHERRLGQRVPGEKPWVAAPATCRNAGHDSLTFISASADAT